MRQSTIFASLVCLALSIRSLAQQGERQGIYQNNSLQFTERELGKYLNAEMIKSILTPGDFVEWKIKLRAGEIVIGEADSDAFDPAMEILDEKGAVVFKNDDRYPGDQRPLAFWRSDKEGEYRLHVRSFQNKAGGQVFTRFQTYESLDLSAGGMVEGVFDATKPFMVKVPMQVGQVKDMLAEKRGEANYLTFNFGPVITPVGLPERSPSLAEPMNPAIRALIAPVAGDYYILALPYGYVGGSGRVRIGTREFVPAKLAASSTGLSATAPTGAPALWELNVKQGDLLEAAVSDLNLTSAFRVFEAPDFTKFDVSKPETNPFYPLVRSAPQGPGPALVVLPGRARDGRVMVFQALRDATLWIASDGAGAAGKQFALTVKPAASALMEGKKNAGKLKIGKFDYWSFDANAGDVMSFASSAHGFSPIVVVRDPDLVEIRRSELSLDGGSDDWRMVFQKPGRYLVQLSCLGDGGGGDYSVSRTAYHAKEFGKGAPAQSELPPGEVQIWKFTAKPDQPLYMHWKTQGHYSISIIDDKGNPSDFQRTDIDDANAYGIIKVNNPTTYIIVLTGGEKSAKYSVELSDLPGYKKGG